MNGLTKREWYEKKYDEAENPSLRKGGFIKVHYSTIDDATFTNILERFTISWVMARNDREEEFYNSNEEMAKVYGVSVSSVKRTIIRLQRLGYIKVFLKKDPTTKRVKGRVIELDGKFKFKEPCRQDWYEYEEIIYETIIVKKRGRHKKSNAEQSVDPIGEANDGFDTRR